MTAMLTDIGDARRRQQRKVYTTYILYGSPEIQGGRYAHI